MPTKILMKLETPQSIATRQNTALNYYIREQKQQTYTNSISLAGPMINRVSTVKYGGCGCGK